MVSFREKIAKEKRKQYINENYWGKPITGFGDVNAKILMIGLAPAAHGGNRTGRVFTGDRSADFLFKCLHKSNLAEDKPTSTELNTCFDFFKKEILLLNKVNTIVTLGKIAFDACINLYKIDYSINKKNYVFSHGCKYKLPDNKLLIGSYHPSPRNVNTGRIDYKKMTNLLDKVKKIAEAL